MVVCACVRACVSVSERAKARERPWGDVVGVGGGGVAWRAVASSSKRVQARRQQQQRQQLRGRRVWVSGFDNIWCFARG